MDQREGFPTGHNRLAWSPSCRKRKRPSPRRRSCGIERYIVMNVRRKGNKIFTSVVIFRYSVNNLMPERPFVQQHALIRRVYCSRTYASSPTCRRERPGSAPSVDDERNADGRESDRSSAPAALDCGTKAAHGAARRATAKDTAAAKRCLDAGDPRGALILTAILWVHGCMGARRSSTDAFDFMKNGRGMERRKTKRPSVCRPLVSSRLSLSRISLGLGLIVSHSCLLINHNVDEIAIHNHRAFRGMRSLGGFCTAFVLTLRFEHMWPSHRHRQSTCHANGRLRLGG